MLVAAGAPLHSGSAVESGEHKALFEHSTPATTQVSTI